MKFRLILVLLSAMVFVPTCAIAKNKCSIVVGERASVRIGGKILSVKVKDKSVCSAKISKKKIVVRGKSVGKTKAVVWLRNGKKVVVRVVVNGTLETTMQPTIAPAVIDDGDDEGTIIRGEDTEDEEVPTVSTATPVPEEDDDDNWWTW